MTMPYKKYHQGFSLIEIMIAMVIGLVLTGGAIQIFISSKATYRLENALSRSQETGRFIVDVMAKEIRMAGYSGCASRGDIDVTVLADNAPPLDATAENAITGYNYDSSSDWNPDVPAYVTDASKINATLLDGTDMLVVQRASECGAQLTGNMGTNNANVQVVNPNSCDFQQDSVVMITDCSTADIFAISSNPTSGSGSQTLAHANNVNSDPKLSNVYGPDSQVYGFLSNTFYIATGASGEPALWLGSWNPSAANDFSASELADGVEDMQILYGEDTGGADEYADTYVTANAVTDWTNVRSVRINLLLRSDDNITTEARAFTFNGVDANTGNDRRLRMVYSSTITVRNRLP
jgi:type IV pilus assembly protein PilW